MTAVEARGRFTRADLEAMPDDGRRYELLDGSIVVSPPSPGFAHQTVVVNLLKVLDAARTPGLRVAVAPLDVHLPTGDVLQPDVLVLSEDIVVADKVEGAPLLAVEILSPGTRRRDVGDKLTAYQDAGVPSYWVVDPTETRLRVWELAEGHYVEVADVSNDQAWTSVSPFVVTVRPGDLLL